MVAVVSGVPTTVSSATEPAPIATAFSRVTLAPTPNAREAIPVASVRVPNAVDKAPPAFACTPTATAASPACVEIYVVGPTKSSPVNLLYAFAVFD